MINFNIKMKVFFVFVGLVSLGSCSIILPQDLTSALDLAYGYLPPIKKGTDSRIGFGFAYGSHADAQVMFELGPQKNTLTLNGQGFPRDSNKRQVPLPAPETIDKTREKETKVRSPPTIIRLPGQVPNIEDSVVELVKNKNGGYEVHQPASPHMSQAIMETLKKLYGDNKEAKSLMKKKERR